MPNMNHHPELMTYPALADLLEAIAALVRAGDSWEGFVEYLIPAEHTHDGDGDHALTVDVRARYRIGNLDGQGGYRFVGELR